MNSQESLIQTFYTAFQQKNYIAMGHCYHDEATFSDPVFQNLQGKEVKAMWHMLCERGKDLELTFGRVQADDLSGSAHWEATYTFNTGNKVHNIIDAAFQFQDGKILTHRDTFDLWKWTRMALGTTGTLLGWSPIVQNKVRTTAVNGLQKFIADHPEYQ